MNRVIIRTEEDLDAFIMKVIDLDQRYIGVDTETEQFDEKKGKTYSWDLGLHGIGVYVNKDISAYVTSSCPNYKKLQYLFEEKQCVFHNAKFDIGVLEEHGFEPNRFMFIHDTMILSWLDDEEKRRHGLKFLAKTILKKKEVVAYDDVGEKPENDNLLVFEYDERVLKWEEKMGQYCIDDCQNTLELFYYYKERLEPDTRLWRAYTAIELPFIHVLYNMERRGVKLNLGLLEEKLKKITKRVEDIEKEAREIAGDDELNLGSPKQLKEYFIKSGVKIPEKYKTPKGEVSTGVEAMEYLKGKGNKFAGKLLEFRELNKLKTTYFESMKKLHKDGVIHAQFKQCSTMTGRLACVHGDTIIHTNKGDLAISKISLTKYSKYSILTANGRHKKIKRLIYKGKEKMYTVSTRMGHRIICTGSHRIWVGDCWKKVGDLKRGDRVETATMLSKDTNKNWGSKQENIHMSQRPSVPYEGEGVDDYTNTRNVSDFVKCGTPFYISDEGEFFRYVEDNKIWKSLKSDAREYSWGYRAPSNSIRQGQANQLFTRRETCLRNLSAAWNNRVFGEEQHNLLSINREYVYVPEKISGTIGGGDGAFGSGVPGYIRGSSCLQKKPTDVFRQAILRIFGHITHYAFNKEAIEVSQLSHILWEDRKKSYLLEHEQGGIFGIKRVVKNGDSTHTGISRIQEFLAGFLFPRKDVSCRNRRGSPREECGYEEEGQDKRRGVREEEHTGKEIQYRGGVQKPKEGLLRYTEDIIESIEVYGESEDVWDLEVEEDHSYFSQGFLNHNSASPNMQNMPSRSDDWDIRELFVPRENYVFAISDYCIASSEYVYLKKGIKKIKDVRVGDYALQPDGSYKKVLRVVNKGRKECFLLKTASGYSVKATADHRFRVFSRNGGYVWKELADIGKGDYIHIANTKKAQNNDSVVRMLDIKKTSEREYCYNTPKKLTAPLAKFLGFFKGDGTHSDNGTVSFCINEKDTSVISEIQTMFSSFFPGVHVGVGEDRGSKRVGVFSKYIRRWLMVNDFVDKACLPIESLSRNKLYALSFLSGYFGADGSVSTSSKVPEVTLSSSRGEVIRQVQIMLNYFGINSSIVTTFNNGPTKDKEGHFLRIYKTSMQRFYEEIGFFSESKQTRLGGWDPCEGFRGGYSFGVPLKEGVGKSHIPRVNTLLANSRNRGNLISGDLAKRVKELDEEYAEKLDLGVADTGFFQEVKSKGVCGVEETYDLEIEDTETFIVNGFVVHNCGQELRIAAYYSRDPIMLKAFENDEDIHQATADALGITRKEAKTVNFLILYGGGAYKLAEGLGCTEEKAQEFLDSYLEKFSGLRKFIDYCENEVKENKEVKLITGRKRHFRTYGKHVLPKGVKFSDLSEGEKKKARFELRKQNAQALRQATNSKVQGAASDMTKLAMLKNEMK